jgi:tetratricopeptide (TPR) repeat protein
MLPFAKDLKPTSFKLGDDAAATGAYVTEPIQAIYDAAVSVLRDASMRAPTAKRGALILGVANAGKTRLAFEIMTRTLPDWRVLVWRPDDKEPDEIYLHDQNLVVFVDDLQEHAPKEALEARGLSQTLDIRDVVLRKMLERARSVAKQVIVVATCRAEDEQHTQARIGWLFTELAIVRVPLFHAHGAEAQRIIEEFRERGAQHTDEWDGTLGSLVLGLSPKRAQYLQLVDSRDPAANVLQAMKLLTLAGIDNHSDRRLRAICSGVFFRADLENEATWEGSAQRLLALQFVTEDREPITGERELVIRKDTYFDRVISDYPAPTRPLQKKRDLEKLLQVLMRLEDVVGIFYLGNTLYKEEDFDQALKAYGALETRGDALAAESGGIVQPAIVWRNKGNIFHRMDRFQEALDAYDRALEIDASVASVWRNKGGVYYSLGNAAQLDGQRENADSYYQQALAVYDRALELDPHYAYAWNGKGRVYRQTGQLEEALRMFDRALEFNANFAYFWRNKADILQRLRQYEEALATYRQALDLDPTYAYAWNGIGNTYNEMKQYEAALDAYDKALQINPKFAYALEGKAAALKGLDRIEDATAVEAQDRDPSKSEPEESVNE